MAKFAITDIPPTFEHSLILMTLFSKIQSIFYFLIFIVGFILSSFGQEKKEVKSIPQDPLQDSISKYNKLRQYAQAVPFAEKWAAQCKKKKGEESAAYGNALNTHGELLLGAGKSKDAEPILLQGLEILKKAQGQDHPDVGPSLNSLGSLYLKMGNYSNAESYYIKALEIRKKVLDQDNPELVASIISLGGLYWIMGNYPKAEPYFLEALEIRQKTLGQNHSDVGSSLNNLGSLYIQMGIYSRAEAYYLKALELRKKVLGQDHIDVGFVLNNLGALYFNTGNYPKVETYLLAALEILKKSLGQDHPNVGRLQNNLGGLYWVMGNYPKAEIFYLEALEILKKALGEDHADIGASLNALGILYKNMGNYPKAEHFYKKALEIKKKALDQNHPDLGTALNNLGNLYIDMENYIKAESLCLRAFEIWKKALGQDHPDVGPSLLNLGNLYSQMGIYPKAEPFYIEALKIRKRSLGEDHLDVKSTIESLACFFWHWGKQKKATPSFLEQQKITKRLIQNYFPYWSDTEKEKFYESQIISENEHFQSFCADQNAANPQLSSEAFNSLLFYKGLLLSNSFKWKQRIRNSKDSTLKTRFEAWEGLANRISKLISSTDSAELAELKELQIEAETIEKELVQKSEAFATMTDKNTYTWKDVQAKLKPGEAAIEMVRVRKKGIEKIVTDTSDQKKPTYYVKGLSDTAYYAAYIVKSSSIYPELVLLKNGNDLEGKWKEYYQNTIRRRVPDSYSYSQFWKPISDKLGQKVKRVYFSPDGIYNSINLNTLQNPKTGEYLLDEKDIRMVTNTKDLVTASNAKPNADYACLVGYPEYNADKSLRAEVVNRERKAPESWYHLNLSRSDVFAELPGTKTEVENISGIISGKGWKVEMLLGEKALEDRVKEVEMPRILHIATHGYFQPDTTKGQNALLRSGLLLTGANKTLAGEKSEDLEDGILTAYEAMNLNLDNTDLVVLSACETGLGEIKNGEGVYGLQRAFKVAGAKSIIMSLWKVSDQATQELMVSFYKNWLGSEIVGTAKSGHSASGQQAVWPKAPTAGTTKRAAFLKAQKVLKVKYPDPYFWGAFVMVGE